MHNLYVCIVKFVNTDWALLPILVGDLVNTSWQFGQYRLAFWSIPIGDLANTGEGTFSEILAGLRSKSGILKTSGVLELCLDMGSRIKKIDLAT